VLDFARKLNLLKEESRGAREGPVLQRVLGDGRVCDLETNIYHK
jgi:hypothetical protein